MMAHFRSGCVLNEDGQREGFRLSVASHSATSRPCGQNGSCSQGGYSIQISANYGRRNPGSHDRGTQQGGLEGNWDVEQGFQKVAEDEDAHEEGYSTHDAFNEVHQNSNTPPS